MLRTWIRGDGTQYSPSALPAFWRRWTDRTSWEQAEAAFGPLSWEVSLDPSEPWRAMHKLLAAVTDHWQPAAANETIYQPVGLIPWHNVEVQMIRQAIEQAIKDRQLTVTVELGRVGPTMQATTLRNFLLTDCALALDRASRYRRCAHCNEWFTPERVDTLFCSNACKQAAYAGRQARDA